MVNPNQIVGRILGDRKSKSKISVDEVDCPRCGKRINNRMGYFYCPDCHFESSDYEMASILRGGQHKADTMKWLGY